MYRNDHSTMGRQVNLLVDRAHGFFGLVLTKYHWRARVGHRTLTHTLNRLTKERNMEMTMGARCKLTAAAGNASRSQTDNPEFICPNCGHRMPMPESGGLHCRNCARYLPTPEQIERVLAALRDNRPVRCHHCQKEVAPRNVCSRCGGRLL